MVERKPVMIIKAPDFEMPEQKPVMIIKAPDLEMPEQKPVMIVKAPAAKKKDEVPVKKWQDKPRRRKRHTYTDDELKVLKKEFAKNSSPSDTKLAAIGLQLGLDVAVSTF